MRTIELTLYKFDELSEEAKQTAIKNERDSEYNVDLSMFKSSATEQIEELGFYDDIELKYSLSYSQGDGLSFSCKCINVSVILSFFAEVLGANKEKTAKLLIENCSFVNIGNMRHDCYASRNDIEYNFDEWRSLANIENIISQVETKIIDLYMNLCKDLEKQGYKEIEYQRSDEYISEHLISNDYDFTIDGLIYQNYL